MAAHEHSIAGTLAPPAGAVFLRGCSRGVFPARGSRGAVVRGLAQVRPPAAWGEDSRSKNGGGVANREGFAWWDGMGGWEQGVLVSISGRTRNPGLRRRISGSRGPGGGLGRGALRLALTAWTEGGCSPPPPFSAPRLLCQQQRLPRQVRSPCVCDSWPWLPSCPRLVRAAHITWGLSQLPGFLSLLFCSSRPLLFSYLLPGVTRGLSVFVVHVWVADPRCH